MSRKKGKLSLYSHSFPPRKRRRRKTLVSPHIPVISVAAEAQEIPSCVVRARGEKHAGVDSPSAILAGHVRNYRARHSPFLRAAGKVDSTRAFPYSLLRAREKPSRAPRENLEGPRRRRPGNVECAGNRDGRKGEWVVSAPLSARGRVRPAGRRCGCGSRERSNSDGGVVYIGRVIFFFDGLRRSDSALGLSRIIVAWAD